MPLPARLVVYGPGKKLLPGPVPIEDVESSNLTGSEIHEFIHQVYTVQKDYFYALLYGVDFVRKHEPLRITKPIDKLSLPLMNLLLRGEFLPQVEIRWYQYQDKTHREIEYFRMTLEHVRLNSINTILPDAKDPGKERYDHLETVSFCYQKITWLYNKGHLLHTDIWDGGFFAEEEEKDFTGKKEDSEEPTEMPLVDKLSLKFTAGVFEEPADGFQFDKKATVKFTFEANRKPEYKENKVYAKLYAVYNGKTEDLSQINEGRLVAENSWSTEFKLKKPQAYENDANRKADAVVEYYAEIENKAAGGSFKGEKISIPKKRAELTIELAINPDDPQFEKYEFKLMSADGGSTYSKTLTVADDAEKGNETLTLIFTDLDSSLNYSLELIIDGTPTGEHIFADCPYLELEKQYGN